MASAFSAFRHFDSGRQALVLVQMQRLLGAKGLSKDTFEIVSRIVNG